MRWVVLQSIVIAAGVACAILGSRWPGGAEPGVRIAGGVLEAAAVALFLVARVALGRAFTPMPRPRENGSLQRGGIYAHVRHPIYGALIVGGVGLALHHSPLVFVPTAALAVVFFFKSQYEEALLADRYPEYAAYRDATRPRFIPFLL